MPKYAPRRSRSTPSSHGTPPKVVDVAQPRASTPNRVDKSRVAHLLAAELQFQTRLAHCEAAYQLQLRQQQHRVERNLASPKADDSSDSPNPSELAGLTPSPQPVSCSKHIDAAPSERATDGRSLSVDLLLVGSSNAAPEKPVASSTPNTSSLAEEIDRSSSEDEETSEPSAQESKPSQYTFVSRIGRPPLYQFSAAARDASSRMSAPPSRFSSSGDDDDDADRDSEPEPRAPGSSQPWQEVAEELRRERACERDSPRTDSSNSEEGLDLFRHGNMVELDDEPGVVSGLRDSARSRSPSPDKELMKFKVHDTATHASSAEVSLCDRLSVLALTSPAASPNEDPAPDAGNDKFVEWAARMNFYATMTVPTH